MSISRAVSPAAVATERRAQPRQNVVDNDVIPVEIGPDDTGGIIINLSEDGAAVQAVASLKPRTSKVLKWRLPMCRERLEMACSVAWVSGDNLVGLHFEGIDEVTRHRIGEWLQERASTPGTAPVPFVPPMPMLKETAGSQAVNHERSAYIGGAASRRIGPKSQFPTANALLRLAETPNASAGSFAQTATQLVPEHGLTLYAELSRLAEQARMWTAADGAAIALRTGGEVVCRGSSGVAPDLGARLEAREGLSAECMKTGRVVICDDTETDSRVDTAVCRALKMRSAVIVAVTLQGAPIGFVECLSSHPHAFSSDSVTKLRGIAEAVLALLSPEVVENSDFAVPADEQPHISNSARVALVAATFLMILLAVMLWLALAAQSGRRRIGATQEAPAQSDPVTKTPVSSPGPPPRHEHRNSNRSE